jgi:hypothetical protein
MRCASSLRLQHRMNPSLPDGLQLPVAHLRLHLLRHSRPLSPDFLTTTAGWLAGNVHLDANTAVRFGATMRLTFRWRE